MPTILLSRRQIDDVAYLSSLLMMSARQKDDVIAYILSLKERR